MRRVKVSVTSDGSSNATAYTPQIAGKIHSITYVKDVAAAGANAYADTVDFTITNETTGEGLWTESNVTATKACYPRTATHSNLGVAATYDGTRPTLDKIAVAQSRIKIVLAQAGAAKVGAFHFLVD